MSPSSVDSSARQYSLSSLNHIYFYLGQTLRREMIHNCTGRASLTKSRTILLAHWILSTAIFASLCFFMMRVVHRTFIFTPIVLRLFTPINTFSLFIHLLAPFGVKTSTMLHLISQRIYIFALFQGFTSLFRQFGCSTGGLHGAACPEFCRLSSLLPVNLSGHQSYKSLLKASNL